MPRKFRRVVRKGYSKKVVPHSVAEASSDSDEVCEAQNVETKEVAVQTEPVPHLVTVEMATQTDEEVQTADGETQVDSTMFNDDYMLCEGNNEQKFHQLIVKHKGIFKDAKGRIEPLLVYCYVNCNYQCNAYLVCFLFMLWCMSPCCYWFSLYKSMQSLIRAVLLN